MGQGIDCRYGKIWILLLTLSITPILYLTLLRPEHNGSFPERLPQVRKLGVAWLCFGVPDEVPKIWDTNVKI